jgi:hypothetical protein
MHTHSLNLYLFLVQRLFATCWVNSEWETSIGAGCHELTPDPRRRRLEICGRLLPILETRGLDLFHMLDTGDER